MEISRDPDEETWFTRVWVVQEVGLAKDALVLYGDVELKYRDLMKLMEWIQRSASQI